ncbi:MAG: ComEC/Rec2 family competence protein [Chloroflexi bacterium]|nr:ComEC/Rec2 family competence protein [Chloroflexota bacterium]
MRLVYLTLGWAAGILLAANAPNNAAAPVWAILAVLALLVVALWWRDSARRWAGLALLAFTLGGLRMALVPLTSDVAQYNHAGGLTLEGVISAEPDHRDDRLLLRLEAESVTRAGQTVATGGAVLVYAPPTTTTSYGDRIRATGVLVTPGEADTFSYADYLARGGVFSIMQDTSVEVLSGGHGSPLYAALLDLKARAYALISRSLPEPAAGLLGGILLGNESGIAPDVREAFNAAGAAHVIAISGFNMALLSGVVLGLLTRFGIRRWRAAVLGIGIIAAYTLLVGASAAVVRAAMMSSLLVIGAIIRRKTYVPASLALVALLLSLQNPTVIWDISFQLSFFATLGLALYAAPLSRRFDALLARLLPRRTARMVGDFLAEPLIVSLAAQITTLPLIVLYFGRLSPVALLVNLLIIPVQGHLLIMGLLAVLVAFAIPTVAQVLFWLDLLPLAWTLGVVRLVGRLPFADAEFHADPRLIALFYLIVLGGALMQATQPAWALHLGRFIRARAVLTSTVFAGVGLAVLIVASGLSRPDGRLHVWLLDVGHSNAVLAQTPGGAHLLVDGGRFPSRLLTAIGDRLPFNDRAIEVLVITQPDENDYAALTAVLDRYEIGVTLYSGQPNQSAAFLALQDRLAQRKVVIARAGYMLELDDGTRLEVLHPQTQPGLDDSLDDHALVARLRYGDVSFLLTGDLSREGQQVLLDAGQWPLATVMQLPKHGGLRSLDEAFLQAVQPQLIVLQSDRANRLGDPDADTLALLGATPVYRTDQGGTIHLWTDGRELWAEPRATDR